jgi:hypothetical protein
MHLCPEGKWTLGEDKWGKIVRVNMLQIFEPFVLTRDHN